MDLFQKIAMVVVGIAIIAGIIFLLTVLPEDLVLIHKPHLKAIGDVKQFSSQSQLHNLSQSISSYFFEHGKPPVSFGELVEKGFIGSDKALTDPWGHEYLMTTEKHAVVLRSAGKDGVSETDDDVSIRIPF